MFVFFSPRKIEELIIIRRIQCSLRIRIVLCFDSCYGRNDIKKEHRKEAKHLETEEEKMRRPGLEWTVSDGYGNAVCYVEMVQWSVHWLANGMNSNKQRITPVQ